MTNISIINQRVSAYIFFFFNDTATTEIYTLSLHDALPISRLELRVQLGARVADNPAAQRGRAEPQPGALLVGQHQLTCGSLLPAHQGAEHWVERELGGATDHLDRLGRVVDAWQLDDYPTVARALQRRLGHPELVDASPQHLQGAVHGVAVDLLTR